jgi:BirA family biotin operon repressor/biotin-[acetyl-CoA-carboxylase] ligase
VSGEVLGNMLGISRVAVWKQIRALAARGYALEWDDRGYRFGEEGEDFLFPWEFGEREAFFRHWESTDSTMNRAAELAAQGAPGGTVITAETQTAGRGRNGRSWVSGRGGLFFTLLERPSLAAAEYPRLGAEIHLALGRALAAFLGKEVRLRWPNDIYAGGRKLGGILTEWYAAGDRIRWLAGGIGVNVNNRPAVPGALSCAELGGRPLSRRLLLLRFLEERSRLRGIGGEELRRQWNALAEGIGRPVLAWEGACPARGEPGEGPVRGIFWGIDGLGRGLLGREEGGPLVAYAPGTVSFRFC